jgi:hypothetical protein
MTGCHLKQIILLPEHLLKRTALKPKLPGKVQASSPIRKRWAWVVESTYNIPSLKKKKTLRQRIPILMGNECRVKEHEYKKVARANPF